MKTNLSALTGLRFIAAFYVFVFHIDLRKSLNLPSPISTIVSEGALGVNIFFVLSGFILYYNYFDKKIGVLKFICKRLAKIYPVYLCGFILCLILQQILHIKYQYFFEILMMNILMIQSYLPKFSMVWYGGGSWSISTEFFFYLMFPLFLFFINRLKATVVLAISVVVYVVSFIPGILYNNDIIKFQMSYTFPPARVSEFIIGMLTACLIFKHKFRMQWMISALIFFLCAIYYFTFGKQFKGWVIQNVIIIPIMFTVLFLSSANNRAIIKLLGNRIMVYLGKISYSFYIVQIPILIFLENTSYMNNLSSGTFFIMILAFNLLLSSLIYHIIELPAHRFLNKKIHFVFHDK